MVLEEMSLEGNYYDSGTIYGTPSHKSQGHLQKSTDAHFHPTERERNRERDTHTHTHMSTGWMGSIIPVSVKALTFHP